MRSTFDRHLWILLFWYLLIKCIQATDHQQHQQQQQTIHRKITGQKIVELADTRSDSIEGTKKVLSKLTKNSDELSSLTFHHNAPTNIEETSIFEDGKFYQPATHHVVQQEQQKFHHHHYQQRQKQPHQQDNFLGGQEQQQEVNNVNHHGKVLQTVDHKVNGEQQQEEQQSSHNKDDSLSYVGYDESLKAYRSRRRSDAVHYLSAEKARLAEESPFATTTSATTTGLLTAYVTAATITTTDASHLTAASDAATNPVNKIRYHRSKVEERNGEENIEIAATSVGIYITQQDADVSERIAGDGGGEGGQHNDAVVQFNDVSSSHKNSRGSSKNLSFPWNIFDKFSTAVGEKVTSILGSRASRYKNNSKNSMSGSHRNSNSMETSYNNSNSSQEANLNKQKVVRRRRSNSEIALSRSSNSSLMRTSDRFENLKPKNSSFKRNNSAKNHKQDTKNDDDDDDNDDDIINYPVPSSSPSDISESDIRYNRTLVSDDSAAAAVPSFSTSSSDSLKLIKTSDVSNLRSGSGSRKTALIADMEAMKLHSNEQIIIIDDSGEEYRSGASVAAARNAVRNAKLQRDSTSRSDSSGIRRNLKVEHDKRSSDDYVQDEPRALPLRPIIRGPYDDEHDEEMSVVYAEQHSEIKLMCEVDMDVASSVWFRNGQTVHMMDRISRPSDYRFIKESIGGLTITNVMLEDNGKWQCEAENSRGYVENARPVKLVVLDRPKAPYLLIDSRRLDAGNIFVPVKENSELSLACISEGGNPKPTLTWEVLLSPGVDRHAQKVAAEVLELEEIKPEKEREPYKINSGAKSEARLPAVYRAHHNARILCVMEHPTLKMRQNASLLLDVQYTPSFAISRTPGFGYPLREGIEVSLKCDVDSNPPSTPVWQKDDGEPPVPQTGDGYLNFTSIRREHSGWYKCTSRHLNFQYSSIGYYLSVRYDSVDVTSEPDDQEVSVAASHNPNKGQLEVQLGGAVTLQCPQGSLGCWSHLDPMTARLRGLGIGLSTPTGQFSLKDVVYQDAGTYKCIGQSTTNKKKLEVLQTVAVQVKGAPTALARNATPVAYPGSPLHLSVEFCANPPAYAARWLHGERVYTPGNQYGIDVLAYGVIDLPTPFCKEARLTYVHMHERVPRLFYFIVSSPGGIAEAMFKVNFTFRHKSMSNSIDEDEEELSEPEEIHFPVFGTSSATSTTIQFKKCFSIPFACNLSVLLYRICTVLCILLNITISLLKSLFNKNCSSSLHFNTRQSSIYK